MKIMIIIFSLIFMLIPGLGYAARTTVNIAGYKSIFIDGQTIFTFPGNKSLENARRIHILEYPSSTITSSSTSIYNISYFVSFSFSFDPAKTNCDNIAKELKTFFRKDPKDTYYTEDESFCWKNGHVQGMLAYEANNLQAHKDLVEYVRSHDNKQTAGTTIKFHKILSMIVRSHIVGYLCDDNDICHQPYFDENTFDYVHNKVKNWLGYRDITKNYSAGILNNDQEGLVNFIATSYHHDPLVIDYYKKLFHEINYIEMIHDFVIETIDNKIIDNITSCGWLEGMYRYCFVDFPNGRCY